MQGSPLRSLAGLGARLRAGAGHALGLAQAALGGFFSDRCPQFAASISFFVLLSVFPLAIFAAGIAGVVFDSPDARRQVVDFLITNLPLSEGQGRREIHDALQNATASAGTFGVLGLLGVLLSASAVMGALRNALNQVWDVAQGRPPLLAKLFDLLLALGAGLLVAASFGTSVLERIATDLGGGAGALISGVFERTSFLIPLALATALFSFLLLVVPAQPTRLRDVWPGILVATAGYKVAEQAFGLYIAHFGRYDAIYGSIGAVIVFMMFLYVAALAFLLGAEFAAHWPAVRESRPGEGEPFSEQLRGFLRGLAKRPAPPHPDSGAGGRREGESGD